MEETALFPNEALFDADGHLTDPGLQALVQERLDELGRLEAAEHLSFCDYCLARYTALIEAMPARLQQPMRDLVPQVQALMRRRSFRIFTNRYFSAAAAVAMAFLLWHAGLFGSLTAPAPSVPAAHTEAAGWSSAVRDTLDDFGNGLSDAFANFQSLARSGLAQLDTVLDPRPEPPTRVQAPTKE